MAVHGKMETLQLRAGADLSALQYKAIKIDGTIAVAGSDAIGILQNKPGAAGEDATVCYFGHAKASAGAAITKGNRVTLTASGTFLPVTSGDGMAGRALESVSSGGVFEGIFNFVNAATLIDNV